MMKWRKLGIVWNTSGKAWWSRSHAMGPTPLLREDGTIRVFLATLDNKGRGRPIYVDVAADDPLQVLRISEHPLMDVGEPGCFDDNGLMPISCIEFGPKELYLYYAGFEICTNIRYRIFTGLAISSDGGESFVRYSKAPILDRSEEGLFFRGGPYALLDNGIVKLWYIAGSEWTLINGKEMPVYDLRYQESNDGIRWSDRGIISLQIDQNDEHGFGRPWIIKRSSQDYQLFYSIRRRSAQAYRLGYAESVDGISWSRKDQEMGLDVSSSGFDSNAIMYSAILNVGSRTFCFYNGNDFGRDGFAVAELMS